MQFIVDGKMKESKFNFYSLDYANTRAKEEKADDLVSIYNNILIYNSFDSLIQALETIFSPKHNGGLTRNDILKGLEQLEDNDTDIDELIESVLSEMEESGFFVKTLKKANRMMNITMEDMAKKKLDSVEKAELHQFQSALERAKERGLI